jgi:predicted phosphate transport protein (TIGR00153 family)
MLAIGKLFGRSPFAPLRMHMEKVANCVEMLIDIFDAVKKGDQAKVEDLAAKISKLEHVADMAKNDIRNHLPKSLFLPIDRASLLEILTIQDSLADKAEDVAILLTIKPLAIREKWDVEFAAFLKGSLETFEIVHNIIREFQELLETSFGGVEAEKVNQMVNRAAEKEHEVDVMQRILLKKLYSEEELISHGTFHLWQHIFQEVGEISDLSEKLAHRVRMTLELK